MIIRLILGNQSISHASSSKVKNIVNPWAFINPDCSCHRQNYCCLVVPVKHSPNLSQECIPRIFCLVHIRKTSYGARWIGNCYDLKCPTLVKCNLNHAYISSLAPFPCKSVFKGELYLRSVKFGIIVHTMSVIFGIRADTKSWVQVTERITYMLD
jgi:hypothetical protein